MKDIRYSSTRGEKEQVLSSEAILRGLAGDGGLYFPEEIPTLDAEWKKLAEMNYREVAFEVMKRFLTDYTEEELHYCIDHAYDDKFETDVIAPLAYADGAYYLELYHGKTIAFKDMALSILPYLLTCAAKKHQITDEIVILTATSGDTGKAALAGFADVPGTRIIVFFPEDGVSPIQKKQMVTQKGANTFVVGVHGNFDDCQTNVKKMFSDAALKEKMLEKGFRFSSANSINIGRLIPQVAYYVYAYAKLLENEKIQEGEAINIVVPTGNFGNILAAYLAKQMGLPVHRLICASNDNRVLTDFFLSGTYDKKDRAFRITTSPSMDILVSSNLERMVYVACGRDPERTAALMASLTKEGLYSLTEEERKGLSDYAAGCATEAEVAEEIADVFHKTGYVMDTHTAVGSRVYRKYKEETKDEAVTVIASTASPFKFTRAVLTAIDPAYGNEADDLKLADQLAAVSNMPIPAAIEEIRTAPVLHRTVCETCDMKKTVETYLGL
ncbi:MAG: threonine synthase [Lachnospiraceae bacterium]|nr:threonine synthase [Lachnospiraceae bacterium]